MPDQESALASALSELAVLGTARDAGQLAALRDRLDAARLRVLVVGEAKRGKSTLINALLGREVLPAGVIPLTAVATTVRYADDTGVQVRFRDGHDEKHPLAALAGLVTERGNPGNRRGITSVTAYVDAPVLAGGVELVDTPGTGSVSEQDTESAHEALLSMDAAVFVLAADPPVSAAERELLRMVAGLSVTTFAVLNKSDHLDGPGLAEALEFTRQVISEVASTSRVYPMSARAALDSADPGFDAFAADFTAYLASRRRSDLAASAAAHARRMTGSLLDEVTLTRRAALMRAGDAAERVREFGARLAEAAVHSRDAVAIANAESARLLFALNDAADADAPRLARQITAEVAILLEDELREAAPGEIERRGRARLAELTVADADAWRRRHQENIEQGLTRAEARLAGDLAAELTVLRSSAAVLLGLDLAIPEPSGRLTEDRRFFYTTAEDAGQTELLAGAIRRRLPGALGRNAARNHLLREAPRLVEQQIGRARGDLQYRLTEATRSLVRVVQRRYADGTGRMQEALAAAARLREASAAEAARMETGLAGREAALRRVLRLLGDPPDTTP